MKIFLLILLIPIFCFSEGIGKVIGVFGSAAAIRNGAETVLERGASLFEHDKIVTQKDSYLKFRFSDGSLISLTPESEYTIQNYKYKPESTQNSSVSKLAKGGLRAITGEIAKTNPDDYSFATPTATMGVRGTIFQILILEGVVFFGCDSGSIVISNSSGESTIGPGLQFRYAEVSSESEAPVLRVNPPAQLNPSLFLTPKSNC